jgi:hypothetical protein
MKNLAFPRRNYLVKTTTKGKAGFFHKFSTTKICSCPAIKKWVSNSNTLRYI